MAEIASVPIKTVQEIGEIGPYHADVVGRTASGGVRGPFELKALAGKSAPTYLSDPLGARGRTGKVLSSSAPIMQVFCCLARILMSRPLLLKKVETVSKTASFCHFNRDFRFNSQSTSMQFTPVKTIGGRACAEIGYRQRGSSHWQRYRSPGFFGRQAEFQ